MEDEFYACIIDGRPWIDPNKPLSDDKKSMSSKMGGFWLLDNCLFQTSHMKRHLLSQYNSGIWRPLVQHSMSGWLESSVQLVLYWCDFKMLNWACQIDANVNLSFSHTWAECLLTS